MATPANSPTFPPLKITALRDNLLLVTGGAGANSGILIGREQVLLIDAKMTAATVHQGVSSLFCHIGFLWRDQQQLTQTVDPRWRCSAIRAEGY
jgi:hypothetical protein